MDDADNGSGHAVDSKDNVGRECDNGDDDFTLMFMVAIVRVVRVRVIIS